MKGIITYNIIQIVGNVIAWLLVAPILDILIYAEPMELVFTQGAVAALLNAISCGVLGSLLMFAWAKAIPAKGSLE